MSEKDSFNRGYLIAVANIMHLHDEDTIAEETLLQLGITRKDMETLGLDAYDLKPLRKLFRNIERKRASSRRDARQRCSQAQP